MVPHTMLRHIVEQIQRQRRRNPAAALAPDATVAADPYAYLQASADLTVRMQLQVAIVNAGISHELTERDLAWAADELDVDYGNLCEELASWL